jgi:hypothetical protein
MDDSQGRLLNVSLLAGSGAYRAYYDRSGSSASGLAEDDLAAGFPPRPALNLHYFGGRTITHLVFVNHYLGGSAAWTQADIASIDAGLAKAMSDNDLQSVIQQYYDAPISSRILPSVVLHGSAPATIYKDQVEAVVARICRHGALDGADTDSTVINILLPRGVQGSRHQPRPGVPRSRPRRRLRRRPGPAHVVQPSRSPRPPASPGLPRHRMAPAAAPAGTVRSQHH